GSGLGADAQRPGGNVTGVQFLRPQLVVRQMEILKQVVPSASRLGFLGNPDVPSDASFFRALERRAAASAVSIELAPVRTDLDYRLIFARLVDTRVQGLIVGPSITEIDPSRSVVRMAAQSKLPTMYPGRQFVEAGGLISYFADPSDQGRHVAGYVDKILRGAAPARRCRGTSSGAGPPPPICRWSSTRATSSPSICARRRRSISPCQARSWSRPPPCFARLPSLPAPC